MTDVTQAGDLSDDLQDPDFDEFDLTVEEYADELEDDDRSLSHAEFDGDTGTLGADLRLAIVAIMRDPFITSETHKREWKALSSDSASVKSLLNNMYLDLEFDPRHEVAYKVQVRNPDGGRGYPTLLRAMSWNREQTVLLVHLRILQRHQLASGTSRVVVNEPDIQAHFAALRPKTATDHHMDATRVKNAIEFVKKNGLLTETKQQGVYVIASALERLMPLEKLRELAAFFATETGETE